VKKVRWGVIGSGGIARRRTIPEGIQPASNAELIGVYGVNAKTNREVAKEFGAHAVSELAELLHSDIDAVYIASPPGNHLEQTAACAKAGKHVLCEKPLGINVKEVEAMIAVCQRSKVRLGTAFMMRFQAQNREALRLIQEGKLGQPTFARAQLSCWYPPLRGAWRLDLARGGGGSFMDMGGHCLDLLEMFFGQVRAVTCTMNRTVHDYEPEDSAVAALSFANGALGVVDAFFCIPDDASRNVLELYGTRGSILASGTIGQESQGEMVAYLQQGPAEYDPKQARIEGVRAPIKPNPVNIYRAEIEEFSQAILEEREPTISAEIGLRNQQLLAACYKSAALRRQVSIT